MPSGCPVRHFFTWLCYDIIKKATQPGHGDKFATLQPEFLFKEWIKNEILL
jgi:hypothetical protein